MSVPVETFRNRAVNLSTTNFDVYVSHQSIRQGLDLGNAHNQKTLKSQKPMGKGGCRKKGQRKKALK